MLKPTHKALQAVCHDFRNVVNGMIEEFNELGCEVTSLVESSDPIFSQRSNIVINLLNEKTGKSVTLPARLTRAFRKDGSWCYRIRWQHPYSFDAAKAL
ncbi:hypothetical protein K2X30_07145 [bacterium]|jgi:hypothetical protein|nr:hypothetical protein [bacterium]